MVLYSPLTRQPTPFSPPQVPMLPPAQPGPSYQHPSPASSKQFIYPIAKTLDQQLLPQPPYWVSHLPSQPLHPVSRSLVCPPSNHQFQKQTLKPVDVVLRHNSKLLNPTGIGRLAIALVWESVFWHWCYGLKQAYGIGFTVYKANFMAPTVRHFRLRL